MESRSPLFSTSETSFSKHCYRCVFSMTLLTSSTFIVPYFTDQYKIDAKRFCASTSSLLTILSDDPLVLESLYMHCSNVIPRVGTFIMGKISFSLLQAYVPRDASGDVMSSFRVTYLYGLDTQPSRIHTRKIASQGGETVRLFFFSPLITNAYTYLHHAYFY